MSNSKGNLLITGGAGFIGSQFVRTALAADYKVIVLDALTYAGTKLNLEGLPGDVEFIKGDIKDQVLVKNLLAEFRPLGLIHFAAESHVDNSILGPKVFIETNILGTFFLLESVRELFKTLPPNFRFLHVSTDEVFGDLGETGYFEESTPYHPHSPYSASKASSDHLVRAWQRTYGLPCIVTNCSNNYGPRQFPEKLIPRALLCALSGQNIPVYGRGLNIRDWIHVEDHCRGVLLAFEKGDIGQTYCLGGRSERKNIEVVRAICHALDELKPKSKGSYLDQIHFVEDRKGHDFRYAIDDSHAEKNLGFQRMHSSFEMGLRQTIDWYLANQSWVERVQKGEK